MKKQKYVIIISGIVIIVVAFFSMIWLSGLKEEPRKLPPREIVRFARAVPVKYADHVTTITATGRVYSNAEVILSAEVTGKILPGSIPFKEGQSFQKGDLILRIYDREAALSLKAQKSGFLNNLANILPDLKIDYENNYSDWYKFFELIDIEKDIPDLPEIKSTKEKVFLASRNILSTYYNIKRAESNFRKHNIYAPFNGSITEVNVEVGGIAGIGARLGNIINTTDLELEVPLDIKDAKWVKIGDRVRITDENGIIYNRGIIRRISGDLDVQTQSISIFIGIKNRKDNPIYKGQYLTAVFENVEVKESMEIPRNSVFNSNNVYVINNGALKKETVNIVRLNEKTLFFNGINVNDTIVAEPLVNVTEGTKVKPLSSQ